MTIVLKCIDQKHYNFGMCHGSWHLLAIPDYGCFHMWHTFEIDFVREQTIYKLIHIISAMPSTIYACLDGKFVATSNTKHFKLQR